SDLCTANGSLVTCVLGTLVGEGRGFDVAFNVSPTFTSGTLTVTSNVSTSGDAVPPALIETVFAFTGASEDCANGIDDTSGGGTDCDDVTCSGDPFCNPCNTDYSFESGEGGWVTDNAALWQYESFGGDGFWATNGLDPVPAGALIGRLTAEFDVPTVADGGPRPQVEVAYRLQGDANPNFDRFVICINDTACTGTTPTSEYATGTSTIPGQTPSGLLAPNFNDGEFDHVFVDVSDHIGTTISVTLVYDSVSVNGAGNVDGLRVTRVTLGSDVDTDGEYEGTDFACDRCWDGDNDSYLHPLSPDIGEAACLGFETDPDCNDDRSDVNPGADEICSEPADEDCDGLINGLDVDGCGLEDCADGLDNNDDGATDCADQNCGSDPFCQACGSRFTFDTGGAGFTPSDDVTGGDVFAFGESSAHGDNAGWATGLNSPISAVASGSDRTRAWLTREIEVPAGTPAMALEIEYALDGGGQDTMGVCFDGLVTQCDSQAPPALLSFSTTTQTGATLVKRVVSIPEGKLGQTVRVTIFYDSVQTVAHAGDGLFVASVVLRSDADEDAFFEAADPACDHCVDADGDGHGAEGIAASFVSTCAEATTDCNDDDTDTHPGQVESCLVVGDQNCDGLLDDQDVSCSVCGDDVVTAGESCDDGGVLADDGCDGSCQVEVGSLHISEIHVTRLGPVAQGEQWFEIYNGSSAAIDLAQLNLTFARETGATQSFNDECSPLGGSSSSIGAGEYYVIALGLIGTADGLAADAACSGGFQLDATGDILRLQSGATELDAVDFRSFSCALASALYDGEGRSIELVDPAAQSNATNDSAAGWCLAGPGVSYATSGKHYGSPGGAGDCAEFGCDAVDDDCDGETDEGQADGDTDGLCDDIDCDPIVGTCTTDCDTDVDADLIPDCRDGCLDADADGWGEAGGAETSTCKLLGGQVTGDCNDSLAFVSPEGSESGGAGTSCNNQLDDNCDGMPDCSDLACAESAECIGEACAGAAPVSCGVLNVVEPLTDEFPCGEGRDAVLEFTPTVTETVQIAISNEGTAQYSVNVFTGTCTDLSCSGATETVTSSCQAGGSGTLAVTAGTTYFLVVDQVGACGGAGSTEGTVRIACAEVCASGSDEDGDGLTDCADGDCVAHPTCANVDFDGDNVANRDELICGTSAINPLSTPTADDLLNPDNDPLLNCVDQNDDGDPFDDIGESACAAGAKNDATTYPGAPKACQQPGVDADCNGNEDIGEDQCGAVEQQCGDGEDNDLDLLTDC
ncbi:MAG: hypothetical protein ACI9OJ_005010, partial [Myxococcota bacterium]